MSQKIIRFIIATRHTPAEFFAQTAAGRMLVLHSQMYQQSFSPYKIELDLFTENNLGLSQIYNRAIATHMADDEILVFAHDDIAFLDYWWAMRLDEALSHFDVVGLAGNTRRVPMQPSWAFVVQDGKYIWDELSHLAGAIMHGKLGAIPRNFSVYGWARSQVKLLDGALMACHTATVRQYADLRFDERFTFHFYDLDFCRQAEKLGVNMGVWDIAAQHESGGHFGSDEWNAALQAYLAKWKE